MNQEGYVLKQSSVGFKPSASQVQSKHITAVSLGMSGLYKVPKDRILAGRQNLQENRPDTVQIHWA
jgi:hypothetical protein